MRLGLFGGSFDPVHYGHLLLAETCREQARLDELWFIPAAAPPHKQHVTLSPAKDRVEMLRLALAGHPSMTVSTREIDRGGVSYTVETLRTLRSERPGDELFWLMGSDTLWDLPKWREPAEILALATPVVVQRRGSVAPDFSPLAGLVSAERLAEFQSYLVEMPVIELSSTELRERAQSQRSLRFRTPRAVERYIESARLYTT
ncbi:MAG TPA: nicotinate-nucleotide adenylyltransferase [Pirellulaceae bacterium]|nr:nicotinate-nucleotide adenylyltransferase [Pirellulaceae bacterium]